MADKEELWDDGYPPPNPHDWAGPNNESEGAIGEDDLPIEHKQGGIASSIAGVARFK